MSHAPWGILLAGGEGKRLHSITVDAHGGHRPKQFCSFGSGRTLLRRAIERSAAVASRERILPVVLEAHRRWWEPELADLPAANIAAQPEDRGTAPAILVALLTILERDPEAQVVVFPSDHYVAREEILRRAVCETLAAAGDRVVLLGAKPETADAELGWIKPVEVHDSILMVVAAFTEKPRARLAAQLLAQGGLVNTMILVARGRTLLDLYLRIAPKAAELLGVDPTRPKRPSAAGLARAYETMPKLDFSRDLLEQAVIRGGRLWVSAVPHCGWSDLGTWKNLKPVWQRLSWNSAALARAAASDKGLGTEYWLG